MTPEKAVQAADIVVTITSARTPVVEDQWVRPGTHISAMGADAIGKHELPISLVQRSRCFADVIDQSCRIGEFQHACNAQLLAREDIVPLGGVITGRIPGRTGAEDITIFDSSGMALQDLAIGDLALQRAIADGVALEIDW
jgi:ornithine cyclodeaminase